MAARLTKGMRHCQALIAAATLLVGSAAAGGARPDAPAALRDCVARARSVTAIAACERQGLPALKARVDELTAAIRARLDPRQRVVFERSVQAWQAFLAGERAMLELSLGLRADGLGPSLEPGAVNALYETRERQLREHLHNLNLARPTVAP